MDKLRELVKEDLKKFVKGGYSWPQGINTTDQRAGLIDVYVEKLTELGVNPSNYKKHSLLAWGTVKWFPRVSDYVDGPVNNFNPEVL